LKSLIKKIANSQIGIYLRNYLNLSSVPLVLNKKFKNGSISDAFPWRTDNGYKTTFKYSDILGLFYKIEDSYVELTFYSQDNNLIKKVLVSQLNYSNELLIDKEFLNGVEGYGVFYIFHRTNNTLPESIVIANKCYVGFSIKNSLNSFIHGNLYAKYQSFDGKFEGSDMVKSSFVKNVYRIQNSFEEFTRSELFFVNPTSKTIKFLIGNSRYSLKKYCSILIDISGEENISIQSRCLFLRPIIFNYKDNFFDVHHA